MANIEDAERQLRNAGDPFELAKADKLGYHLRWKASKANPREYGDKVEHDVNLRFSLSDELAGLNGAK